MKILMLLNVLLVCGFALATPVAEVEVNGEVFDVYYDSNGTSGVKSRTTGAKARTDSDGVIFLKNAREVLNQQGVFNLGIAAGLAGFGATPYGATPPSPSFTKTGVNADIELGLRPQFYRHLYFGGQLRTGSRDIPGIRGSTDPQNLEKSGEYISGRAKAFTVEHDLAAFGMGETCDIGGGCHQAVHVFSAGFYYAQYHVRSFQPFVEEQRTETLNGTIIDRQINYQTSYLRDFNDKGVFIKWRWVVQDGMQAQGVLEKGIKSDSWRLTGGISKNFGGRHRSR